MQRGQGLPGLREVPPLPQMPGVPKLPQMPGLPRVREVPRVLGVPGRTRWKRSCAGDGWSWRQRASALTRDGVGRPRLSLAQIRCHLERSDYL